MAILKFISIKEVIAKIYRDLNIEQEERWVDLVEWCGEALQKIGAHPQYIEQMETLEVENYRATLPCNIHKITQIDYNGHALIGASGSFDNQNSAPTKKSNGNNFVYSVNDAFINTNFEKGFIDIAFLGIPIDAEGFPLVPDDESYKEAMLKYTVMKLKYPEYISGRMNPNIYKDIEKSWHKYCAQARGEAYMPSIDELESIKNQWMRLMPVMQEHKNFFKNLNQRERIAGNRLPNTNRY